MKITKQSLLLLVLAIASSFSPLSIDFFAPSVPHALHELNVDIDTFQLSIYAFFIGFALGALFWGTIADSVGRFPTLLAGIGLYVIASLLCTLPEDIGWFAALRFLQGLGVGAGSVIARAIVRDIYGQEGITAAMSKVLAIMVWVPAIAPVLGGYLSWYLHWRASFVVMAVVALLAMLGVYLLVPRRAVLPGNTSVHTGRNAWLEILLHRQFMKNALSNMFVMATIILFMSHYAYLTETYYDYRSTDNGLLLTFFNLAIYAGMITVSYLLRRFPAEVLINTGIGSSILGWFLLLACSAGSVPHPAVLILASLLACPGLGAVFSLCGGQALVPFSYNAGKASALFMCLQSLGVASLVYIGRLVGVDNIATLAALMLLCSALSMFCRLVLRG